MHDNQVWTIIHKQSVPSNRKILGNRWVFAQKDDGRFRARNVAQGFTQIPGKDFQEHHSPVVNDTTVHVILVLKILKKLCSGQFDIVTAFLYGELDETLYMALPEGYIAFLKQKKSEDPGYKIPLGSGVLFENVTEKDYCLSLEKAIYGLVQAARQWWKKFKQTILAMGYTPSRADPCLFFKNNNDEISHSFLFMLMMEEYLAQKKRLNMFSLNWLKPSKSKT
jgi:hypothetical protein